MVSGTHTTILCQLIFSKSNQVQMIQTQLLQVFLSKKE